jgi:hypothetical protein
MVNLAIGEILLPLRTLLLTGSLIRLPDGTILSHVVWQSTLETHTKSLTSMRGGILLVWGGGADEKPVVHSAWAAAQLVELPVLGMKHLIPWTLHLKVGTLHRELGTLVLEL